MAVIEDVGNAWKSPLMNWKVRCRHLHTMESSRIELYPSSVVFVSQMLQELRDSPIAPGAFLLKRAPHQYILDRMPR